MTFLYDPSRAAQVSDNDVLPAGEYEVLIDSVEDKETKAGTGRYLEITFIVTSGRFKNFTVKDRINYRNQNTQAEEIGYRSLKKLAKVIFGRDDVQWGPDAIIGKKIGIKTTTKEGANGYTNVEIKNYIALTGKLQEVEPMDRTPSRAAQNKFGDDDDVPF